MAQEHTADMRSETCRTNWARKAQHEARRSGLYSSDAVPPCNWAVGPAPTGPDPSEMPWTAGEPLERPWRSPSGTPLPLSSMAISTPARELTAES